MTKRVGGRRWTQWTEAQARGFLEELASSGESATAFARRKGVSKSRLQYWQERLKGAPAFVRVELPRVEPSGGSHVEIVCAGVTVRVREDMDVERIAALASAIARARC
jgi:hypothetical protein